MLRVHEKCNMLMGADMWTAGREGGGAPKLFERCVALEALSDRCSALGAKLVYVETAT